MKEELRRSNNIRLISRAKIKKAVYIANEIPFIKLIKYSLQILQTKLIEIFRNTLKMAINSLCSDYRKLRSPQKYRNGKSRQAPFSFIKKTTIGA